MERFDEGKTTIDEKLSKMKIFLLLLLRKFLKIEKSFIQKI